MNERRMKIIFRILVITWMVVIFCFSAADGKESSETSHEVGMFVGRILIPGFKEMSAEEQEEWAGKLDYPIRKAAHASEYALLALLIFGALGKGNFFDRNRYSRYLWSLLFTALYAGSDEIHQLFVPGRSGNIIDVGIDSLGALTGLLVLFLIRQIIERRRKKKAASGGIQDIPAE